MTDNEIIKALECCASNKAGKCNDCIFNIYDKKCRGLTHYVLDLINRQKAEVEKWKNDNANMAQHYLILLQEAQAEAIKGFAERIKRHCTSIELNEYIDSIVEEMVGE